MDQNVVAKELGYIEGLADATTFVEIVQKEMFPGPIPESVRAKAIEDPEKFGRSIMQATCNAMFTLIGMKLMEKLDQYGGDPSDLDAVAEKAMAAEKS